MSIIDPAGTPEAGPQSSPSAPPEAPVVADEPPPSPPSRPAWRRPLAIAVIVLALLGGGVFAAKFAGQKSGSGQADATQQFGRQSAPLASLSKQLGSVLGESNVLTVNGQLRVSGPIVLEPSIKPSSAEPGQLYYDQASNLLGYYNGKGYVYLQPGGNTFVTNNITNAAPVTNNNVTNVTNVTNVSGGGGGFTGSGTPGTLAMFTAGTALGDSVVTQSGTNLTVGSNAGASATTVQGGAGNVLIATAPAVGTGGGITIQTGDSSTTAAGNVTIDTGNSQLSGTVIDTKDFEDATTDNMGDSIFGDNSTVTVTTAQAETGTHSLAISVGSFFYPTWGLGEGTSSPPCKTLVTGGHTYAFTAWVRAATNSDNITGSVMWSNDGYGGGGEISQANFGTVTDITTGWRKVAGVLTAPAGSYSICEFFSSNNATAIGETHYFDNITVTDLSASTSQAAVNIATTNAQALTLGNSAMFAPTNIYGGGVNLNGGAGIDNINAQTIQASSGDATYVTTSGALNITSATTASWGVGGSLFGGSLTVHAGNSGSNNNGGNLYLQSGTGSGTGVGGSVVVKPGSDTPNTFQIQNAAGNPALQYDAINGVLTTTSPSACDYNNYNAYVLGRLPSAYWKLEDAGATAVDSSGNNNTGTLSNVTTGQTPGPFSCANTHPYMAFNSASPSQITTTTSATAPNSYSEVVMFRTNSTNGVLVGYSNGGNHDRELGIDGNGKLYARIYNGTDAIITSPQAVDDSNWHVAVATVSAAGMFLYLDGVQVASNASYNNPQSYIGAWVLGGGWSMGGPPYNGDMAQVAVYTSALNSLQVQTLADYAGFYSATLAAVGIGTTAPAANLDVEGTALFKNGVNSPTAFQVQNAAGNPVLNVDTTTSSLTVHSGGAAATFGSELITTDFTNAAWTSTGWTTTIANATHTAGNTNGLTTDQFAATASATYQITFTVTGNPTAGETVTPYIGAVAGAPISGNVTNEVETVTAAGTLTPALSFVPTTNWNGTISAVSVKQITGSSAGLSVLDGTNSFGLEVRTTGVFGNTFVGDGSGQFNTTGNRNTGVGAGALQGDTTGQENTAAGFNALEFNSTGNENAAFGRWGLQFNVSGSNNSALGFKAGISNTTGSGNTFVGSGADLNPSVAGELQNATAIGVNATVAQSDSLVLGCISGVNGCTASTKVGIGTSAPSTALAVSGVISTAGPNGALNLYNQSVAPDTNGFSFNSNNNNLYIYDLTDAQTAMEFNRPNTGADEVQILNSWGLSVTGNNAAALLIQNSTNSALLDADTTTMTVTVQKLVVTGDLTVNGHIITGGSTPGIAAGAAACTTPTVTIAGTDTTGTITVTTGTGCSGSGALATITFSGPFASAPHVVLTPGSPVSQTLGAYVDDSTVSTTSFVLGTNATPVDSTTYKWNYWVAQ